MNLNENVMKMLMFYDVQIPTFIEKEDLLTTLNKLGDNWKVQLSDCVKNEMYAFNENCHFKLECCSDCENISQCSNTCYKYKAFDCCDCTRNNL